MPVTFSVDSVEDYEGSHQLVRGRATLAADPDNPANATITDLRLAPRGPDGRVTIESDVVVLRPTSDGNRCLLTVVPNRGLTLALPFSNVAPTLGVGGIAAGDAWLLQSGWSVAWIGWQWDVRRGSGALGCTVPQVADHDGWTRLDLQSIVPADQLAIISSGALPLTTPPSYPAADLDQVDAELTVAPGRAGAHVPIPRDRWSFVDELHITLEGGFEAGSVYSLRYRTSACPVVGAGLLAFRDVAAALRFDIDDANPLAGLVDHSFAWGVSQSGRFLRQLVHDRCNVDEEGRAVFDAVLPFIAGASRGEFNQRYGHPSELLTPGPGHQPPFTLDDHGGAKIVIVNSASEYWRSDGSLAHVSSDGSADLPEAADTRIYAIAGSAHAGGADLGLQLPSGPPTFLNPMPAWRAILDATRAWVVDGVEPPPSTHPRLDDGTATPRDAALSALAHLDVTRPPLERLAVRRTEDGSVRPVFVSAVDADGNEVAGVRLPEVAVPLAAHTGWSELAAQGPRWDFLAGLIGMAVPFTPEQIAARYRNRDDYLTQVRTAADELVADRLLLAIDVDVVVDAAGRTYDRLAS